MMAILEKFLKVKVGEDKRIFQPEPHDLIHASETTYMSLLERDTRKKINVDAAFQDSQFIVAQPISYPIQGAAGHKRSKSINQTEKMHPLLARKVTQPEEKIYKDLNGASNGSILGQEKAHANEGGESPTVLKNSPQRQASLVKEASGNTAFVYNFQYQC